MTDEKKEVVQEEKNGKCECRKCLKKFLVKTCAVFVGTTLAILVSASLLKPKAPCPPPMFGPQPGIENHMGPGMNNHGMRHHRDFKGAQHQEMERGNIAPGKDFQPMPKPEQARK